MFLIPQSRLIDFFESLPVISDGKYWAIYVVVMEKAGSPTKMYIGSGTEADYRVSLRLKTYYLGSKILPRFAKSAFQQGYHRSHFGLLCWTSVHTPGLVPSVRARFLGLEALFTYLFFPAFARSTDIYFKDLLLWDRASVTWRPLCTHLPLSENILGDINMSQEELEIVAALRKTATAHRLKEWRAAKKAKDVAGYRAHDRKMENAWAEKNRGRVNKTAAKIRPNAIDSKRFFCEVCQAPLQSQHAFDAHLKTQAYADAEAGIKKLETSAGCHQDQGCSGRQQSRWQISLWTLQEKLQSPVRS